MAERALGLAARQLGDTGRRRGPPAPGPRRGRRRQAARAGGRGPSQPVVRPRPRRRHGAGAPAGPAGLGPALAGADRGRALAQRAVILQRAGRHEESLAASRDALAVFRRTGDAEAEAKVLSNRAILHAYLGDLRSADAELRRAAACNERLGLELATADARHNLGFVAARSGDVPTALSCYDAAADSYKRLGALPTHDPARPERGAARRAPGGRGSPAHGPGPRGAPGARHARRRGRGPRDGGPGGAAGRRRTPRRRRWPRRPVASSPTRTARGGRRWPPTPRCGPAGWPTTSVTARGRRRRPVGRAASTASGGRRRPPTSGSSRPATTLRARRRRPGRGVPRGGQPGAATSGPADLRARAWHAEALLRLARGDDRGAAAALRAGLRVIEQHQATLGATELRVHAAGPGRRAGGRGARPRPGLRAGPGGCCAGPSAGGPGPSSGGRRGPRPTSGCAARARPRCDRRSPTWRRPALAGQDATRLLRRQAGAGGHHPPPHPPGARRGRCHRRPGHDRGPGRGARARRARRAGRARRRPPRRDRRATDGPASTGWGRPAPPGGRCRACASPCSASDGGGPRRRRRRRRRRPPPTPLGALDELLLAPARRR